MSTDRELLELAAKAAGIQYNTAREIDRGWILSTITEAPDLSHVEDPVWDPLGDDGDALRLAADVPDLNISWVFEEAWGQFPLAADQQMQRREYIRRLIVSCAAGHGRAVP